MRSLFSRALYFLLKILSKLPLSVLYQISTFFYFLLFYVVQYRKKTVIENLKKSFPEKNEQEIQLISKKYYKYLSQLIIETVKGFSLNKSRLKDMVKEGHSAQVLNELYEKNESAIVVMPHYGNWEILCKSAPLYLKHEIIGAYKPLKDKYFDTKIKESREEFGTKMVAMDEVLRAMKSCTKPYLLVLIADQSPSGTTGCEWVKFLNQDTAMIMGAQKLSHKYDLKTYYIEATPIKKGVYEIRINYLGKGKEYLQKSFFNLLEKSIIKHPEYWLWSHKRWKHKPSTNE